MRYRFTLLFSLFLIFSSHSIANVQPRIVGGNDVSSNSVWPFMVSLHPMDEQFIYTSVCGGTLIGDRWVLTAANCLIGSDASDWAVQVGHININPSSFSVENFIYVDSIYLHHNYDDDEILNDIAIMKLSSSIAGIDTVPYDISSPVVDETVVAIGWGETDGTVTFSEYATNDRVDILQQVDLKVVECSIWGSGATSNNICATDADTNDATDKGTCYGDSGGPILYDSGGIYYQVGITSFGSEPCVYEAAPGVYVPGAYTRVANYTTWIDQVINDLVEPYVYRPPSSSSGGGGSVGIGGLLLMISLLLTRRKSLQH
jgi:secreted trypsin-like serine protease